MTKKQDRVTTFYSEDLENNNPKGLNNNFNPFALLHSSIVFYLKTKFKLIICKILPFIAVEY